MKTKGERGYVLITMAVAAVAIIGALGMAVDVGRAFITKSETQAFCDSAATAAALKLDGTTTGISNAKSAVSATKDYWNFDTATVSSPTTEFATGLSGPWSSNPASPSGYTYVRVRASVALPLYFAPVVTAWFTGSNTLTQNVYSSAVGAQVAITSFKKGLEPYTAVTTQPTATNYGFTVGSSYDIQWPNTNANGFIKSPCSGDPATSQTAVLTNWGSSTSGYWGSNSNSTIYQEVLDEIQLAPISIGENIYSILTPGNKKAQATALDTRVQEDGDPTDNSLSDYFASSTHNGRRIIDIPVVDPTSYIDTTVEGYGAFLLISDGTATSGYYAANSGNEAFCAIYVGPYVQGAQNGGAGGSGGAFKISLVQ